jgi:hypothetical protein
VTWTLSPLRTRKDGSVTARAFEGSVLRWQRRYDSMADARAQAAGHMSAAYERMRKREIGDFVLEKHGGYTYGAQIARPRKLM